MNISSSRKGFALILTLSVLTVIIALTGVLVGYLDSARKDASSTKAMIQANLYFANIKEILSGFKERKTLYNTLYLTPLPLQSEEGDFSLMLSCRPQDNGININWLGFGNDPVMQKQYNVVQKVFDRLVQQYALRDPVLLQEMILRQIEPTRTTAEEQRRLRQKNGIISYEEFEHILSRYQFETDDANVGKVAWRKYFTFHAVSKDPKENLIAGDYLSKALLSVLFDIDAASLDEEWVEVEGALKALLTRYGIAFDRSLFSESFIDRSVCEVRYGYEGAEYMFWFVDTEGEVKDFEFYGKQ